MTSNNRESGDFKGRIRKFYIMLAVITERLPIDNELDSRNLTNRCSYSGVIRVNFELREGDGKGLMSIKRRGDNNLNTHTFETYKVLSYMTFWETDFW